MKRRCGNELAMQSVPTEQDQRRSLRYYDYVEIWEYAVGSSICYDEDNVYEHYDFQWSTLEEPKLPMVLDERKGMTTIEAIAHDLEPQCSESRGLHGCMDSCGASFLFACRG